MRYLATTVLLGCLLAVGCGTGSGGGSGPEALFVGDYWAFEVSAPRFGSTVGRTFQTSWGIGTSDGVSNLALDFEWSEAEYYNVRECTYTIGTDHALRIECAYPIESVVGGIEPLGRVGVGGTVGDWDPPRVAIFLARIGTFDDATIAGTYHLAGVTQHPATNYGSNVLSDCRLTFDGYGFLDATDFTWTAWNSRRTETPPSTLTYAVGAEGGLWMDDLEGDPLLRGGVLAGGALAIAVGSCGDWDEDNLYVLVRESQGLTAASLDGEWWMVGFQSDFRGVRSFTGVFTADGSGGCGFEGQENHDLTVGSAGPFAWLYRVLPDGELQLTDPDGRQLVGGLSGDRAFFAVAGGGWDPMQEHGQAWFLFGVRR